MKLTHDICNATSEQLPTPEALNFAVLLCILQLRSSLFLSAVKCYVCCIHTP